MKRYFKDVYGCTASIAKTRTGFRLRVSGSNGQLFRNDVFGTYRGARNAMGRMSDGWREV